MGFLVRRLGAALLAALSAAPGAAAPVPVPNAKFEPPTASFQARPGRALLDDFKKYLKLNGATKEALEKFDAVLEGVLGKEGFAGIDLGRPIGGYAYLRAKPEQSSLVLAIPFTTEKEALGLVARLRLDAKEESKPKGLYKLSGDILRDLDVPTHLRFHDRHAYVSFNGGADALADPDALVPIARLADGKETAVLAGTLFGKRIPKELIDMAYPIFAEADRDLNRMQARAPARMPKSVPPLLREMLGWGRRCYDLVVSEGDTLTGRLLFDAKTGEADLEATLTPKAKGDLADDLATFKPAKGRFHQLVGAESVAGGWLVLPGPFPKGVRTTFADFWGEWIPMIHKEIGGPAEMAPLFDAVAEIARKALAAGELDAGAALSGPTEDGHYTAVAALGLDDPLPLLKAALAVAKDLPKEFAAGIELNAYKVGDVPVHKIALEKRIPAEFLKVLGEKAALHVAIGNGGLFLAVGPNAKGEIGRAMALMPMETRAFDARANVVKGMEFMLAAGGNARGLGGVAGADRVGSFYAFDARGGSDFKVRTSVAQVSLLILMELAGGGR